MKNDQLSNLLGALAVALTDAQSSSIHEVAALGQSSAATLTTLGVHGGLTISAMSRVLGLSHSATVRVIGRLVERGWVERGAAADRRHVRLELTPEGRRVRARLVAARRKILEGCIADWPLADRESLGRLVARLLDGLIESRYHADHICRLCDEAVCGPDICPVEQAALRLPSDDER